MERAAVLQETQGACSAYHTEYLLLRLALVRSYPPWTDSIATDDL
jgi:hypothetical protein